MTKTIQNEMTSALNELFADLDAEVLEASKVWAAGRVAAIKEFKTNGDKEFRNEKGQLRFNMTHKYYARLFAIAGGKTWYNVFNGRNEQMINEFVTKNCKAIAEKRNAAIVRKVVKAGATKIIGSEYQSSKNGFDGYFELETDTGAKRVTINTIRAGGYNIQCLHLRVLTKVR